MKKILCWFRIHRYKIIDLCYEQIFEGYELDMVYSNLYCDYKIVKCRWCGTKKLIYTNIYTAEKRYVPIGSILCGLRLVNKFSIL